MNTHRTDSSGTEGPATGKIVTVTGAIDPGEMGVTLVHEHAMSTFGAASARYPDYDVSRLFASVRPYLKRIKEMGCQTLVDCTAAYFGRHPEILRRLSLESGLLILTNTGYYGAADDRYVPPHAYRETADQLAARWTREWLYSIDGTGVYPGFIKTAVDPGPLSEIDRKLIVAAARTHARTGLTIQTHTGDNWDAVQAIPHILSMEQVHPSAWIWIHAHNVQDAGQVTQVAEQGAWISFDGLNPDSAPHILHLVQTMRRAGYLNKVLLSHDGDSYYGDGECRPYHFLFSDFIPTLRENGFSDQEIRQLTVDNPRRAFTVAVRPAT
ncbi:MAG: phosphotriesterase [Anaerolineae bacterium]|nr:phosphotriesterase [Anaerolineae bacterium]